MNIFELAALSSLFGGMVSGAFAGGLTGGVPGFICGLVVGLAFGVGIHFGIPIGIYKYSRKHGSELNNQFSKHMPIITLVWACAAPFITILLSASLVIAIFSKSV